jgi:hypothetical protein
MNERGFYEELACVYCVVCMNSYRNRGQYTLPPPFEPHPLLRLCLLLYLYSALPHSLSIHLYFRLPVFRMSFRLYTTMLSVPFTVVISWFCVCQCYTVCLFVSLHNLLFDLLFLSVCLSFSLFACLSVCLYVFFLFVCLFVFLFVCLSVCLFVCSSAGRPQSLYTVQYNLREGRRTLDYTKTRRNWN